MSDSDLPRETGQEKSTETCPTCGGELNLVTSPYGGVSTESCPKCYPPAEKAAEAPDLSGQLNAPRVLGSQTEESQPSQHVEGATGAPEGSEG